MFALDLSLDGDDRKWWHKLFSWEEEMQGKCCALLSRVVLQDCVED